MRQLMLLGLAAGTMSAIGCNVLTGRCDCTHDPAAVAAPVSGPNYHVVNHGTPTSPGTVTTAPAPMPIPTAPMSEKTPEPAKTPAKELPNLPKIPDAKGN